MRCRSAYCGGACARRTLHFMCVAWKPIALPPLVPSNQHPAPLIVQKWDAHGHGIRELAPAAASAGADSLSFLYNWEACAAAQAGGPQARRQRACSRESVGRKTMQSHASRLGLRQAPRHGRPRLRLLPWCQPRPFAACCPAAPAAHQASRVSGGGGSRTCWLGRGGECAAAPGLAPPCSACTLHGAAWPCLGIALPCCPPSCFPRWLAPPALLLR